MALFGGVAGLGVLLIVQGVRGRQILPDLSSLLPNDVGSGKLLAWIFGAALVGLAVFAATGWPVAALAAAVGVFISRSAVTDFRAPQREADLVQAIASWTEMVRDNMAGAAGLEQALIASAEVAPLSLQPHLRRFVARLERMSLAEAVRRLGDDVHHPSMDLIVVALINATRLPARDLGPLLSRLAEAIRDDVRMRLRIEVSRARIRTSARIVVATTLFTIGFLFVFGRNLLVAYDTMEGQLWLILVLAIFVASARMMKMYAGIEAPERFAARRVEARA